MNAAPDDLHRQLEAYFDGTLSREEKAALETQLTRDPEARKAYWEMARWHAALSTWGSQQAGRKPGARPAAETPGRATAEAPAEPRVVRFPRWAVATLAAAACIALGVALAWRLGARSREEARPVAELVLQRDARWGAGAPLRATAMRPGHFALEAGVATFDTAAGAVVTVAAPAEFTFTAADHLELTQGRMVARMVRHGSGRLTVSVHGVQVRDLGTAFGIDAREPGKALVSVFDGLVAVSTAASGESGRWLVAQGQSVIAETGQRAAVQTTAYSPEPFSDLWPLTVGINESSKLVSFLPPGPVLHPLRDYHDNNRLFLFPERQNVAPEHPVPVDVSPDTPNWPQSPVTPYPLPAGEAVNSYLVFYQPDPVAEGTNPQHLAGTIVFRHRVLGIICSDQWLEATDPALGSSTAAYATPHQHRGLEEADKDNYRGTRLHHDSVTIDPDGKTVHFDFYVSDEREELRIVVAAR